MEALADRYRKALDEAVCLATKHNVAPIRGRTLILVNGQMSGVCTSAKGLGKPRQVCLLYIFGCLVQYSLTLVLSFLWKKVQRQFYLSMPKDDGKFTNELSVICVHCSNGGVVSEVLSQFSSHFPFTSWHKYASGFIPEFLGELFRVFFLFVRGTSLMNLQEALKLILRVVLWLCKSAVALSATQFNLQGEFWSRLFHLRVLYTEILCCCGNDSQCFCRSLMLPTCLHWCAARRASTVVLWCTVIQTGMQASPWTTSSRTTCLRVLVLWRSTLKWWVWTESSLLCVCYGDIWSVEMLLSSSWIASW